MPPSAHLVRRRLARFLMSYSKTNLRLEGKAATASCRFRCVLLCSCERSCCQACGTVNQRSVVLFRWSGQPARLIPSGSTGDWKLPPPSAGEVCVQGVVKLKQTQTQKCQSSLLVFGSRAATVLRSVVSLLSHSHGYTGSCMVIRFNPVRLTGQQAGGCSGGHTCQCRNYAHRAAATQCVSPGCARQSAERARGCFHSERLQIFVFLILSPLFPMLLEHTKRLKMKIFCRWDHSLVG